MKFNSGDIVRVDTDNEQWGRVCGTAEVLETTTRRLFVSAHSIRACIWINRSDATKSDDTLSKDQKFCDHSHGHYT